MRYDRLLRSLWSLAMTMATFGFWVGAVEIPLEGAKTLGEGRGAVGFVDLQEVFEAFPEKRGEETELKREIDRRRGAMTVRQNALNHLREMIRQEEQALALARQKLPVTLPSEVPAAAPATAIPYPEISEEALLGTAPPEPSSTGSEIGLAPGITPSTGIARLPGVALPNPEATPGDILREVRSSVTPVVLTDAQMQALERDIAGKKAKLLQETEALKQYRAQSIQEIRNLELQKSYGLMTKIYAVLQGVAREESVTVVLDKSFVLYGERAVDLTRKLLERMRAE